MNNRSMVLALGLVTIGGASGAALVPTVMLDAGAVEGMQFGAAPSEVAFLGVPFAAPPTGPLRWKPPQPVGKWRGARQATQFGAQCPQPAMRWLPELPWSEDCLYLNVWTTRLSPRAKLPVIVYFHGGGNKAGRSQQIPLGPALSRLGVVFVSANYRLGPLGFLAHPALTAESEHHSSGNYGLLDQLQALRWVRENISRFGGDAAQVTVMGQSAGAADICLLMASPLSAGLFQRAILQSGECQSALNTDIRKPLAYNGISGSGEAAGERLANDLGVAAGADAAEKLRSLSAEKILEAWKNDPRAATEVIVDGWVIPQQPAKIFADGKQLRIPVLVGSNLDEATIFTGHKGPTTLAEYWAHLRTDTGKHAQREFKAYPAATDAEVPGQYLRLQSDLFGYGALSIAKSMTRAAQPAYLYCFSYVGPGKRAPLGAFHGEELMFLSNVFPDDWERSPEDDKLGAIMRAYWTQFARTGAPNGKGLQRWPAYDPLQSQCFELGRTIGPRPVAAQLEELESIMGQIVDESAGRP